MRAGNDRCPRLNKYILKEERMFKKLVSMIVVAGLLMIGGTAFAMNKGDKSSSQKPIIMQGNVTAIKGNIITIKDNKGIERQEDCGKG